jgi:hypothetical protein
MMFKPPPRFIPSSIINETDEVRAERKRDLKEAVRRAVPYLGADEVKRVVHDIVRGHRGNTPDDERNARILAEYDLAAAKGSVTLYGFARRFCGNHPGESVEAIRLQARRLLKARARRERWKAKADLKHQEVLQRLGKSLVGKT